MSSLTLTVASVAGATTAIQKIQLPKIESWTQIGSIPFPKLPELVLNADGTAGVSVVGTKSLSLPKVTWGAAEVSPAAARAYQTVVTVGSRQVMICMTAPGGQQPSGWKSTQTNDTSKNGQILRSNLGLKKGDGLEAHHIVQSTDIREGKGEGKGDILLF